MLCLFFLAFRMASPLLPLAVLLLVYVVFTLTKKWNQSVQKQVEIICQERAFIISFQVLFYLSSSTRKLHNKCIEVFVQRAQSLRNNSWFIIFPFFVSELHTYVFTPYRLKNVKVERRRRREKTPPSASKNLPFVHLPNKMYMDVKYDSKFNSE